jgi:hypothetical protein
MGSLAVGLVTCLLVGSSGAAEGWSLPNLNPFAKKKSGPYTTRTSDRSGWKLPSLWPKAKRTTTSGPSTWQKMTTSTKTAAAKTADFLNPFDDANDAQPAPSPTGYGSPFSTASAPKQSEGSGSMVPQWLWGGGAKEEGPKRPKTVNEFLSQPKPEF